jgi:AraC-like DNA-binding protein
MTPENPYSPLLPWFRAEGFGPLVFEPVLPLKWEGKVLPGSKAFYYQGELGEVVIQEYFYGKWCFRYLVLKCIRKTLLYWIEEPWLRLQFCIQGTIRYQFQGGSIRLSEGRFNTVWASGRESSATFFPGREYVLFHVLYGPELVRQVLPEFPGSLPPETATGPIEKEWNSMIAQILDAPYDEDTRRFYFENRAGDILLFRLFKPDTRILSEDLTKDEERRIHEVDDLIVQGHKEWLTIPVLAKKIQMEEFKLKMAFRKVMDIDMFERLIDVRLEKARNLLLETEMEMKAICQLAGYKSLSGFENAFRKKYGRPPLQYRKGFRQAG